MAGTALPAIPVSPRTDIGREPASQALDKDALEIVYRPDPTIGDGEYSNNGWLQETPKTVTRLTWDNAVLMSAATAQQLGLSDEQYVSLQLNGGEAKGGVLIVPGH